jgi:hypothetical protein
MLDSRFVLLGAAINLLGSSRYVIDTLRGKAKPNRVSWILWALAPLIAFAAEIHQGVGLQSLMTFMVGFGPLMVVIASFVNRKAVWKLTAFDLICGALSLVGLTLWLITRHGNIAILFSIIADTLASIPTVVKSYREPETESHYVFRNGALSAAITILTIKNWTFANYGFPAYILSICLLLYILIRFKLGEKFQQRL